MSDDNPIVRRLLSRDYEARSTKIDMVRTVVEECRDGVRKPARFVDRPVELLGYQTPEDVRNLLASKAPSDAKLRLEMLRWNADNHEACLATAESLVTLMKACVLADELMATAEQGEAETLWGWRKEIAAYAQLVFHADLKKAPTSGEDLWTWCYQTALKLDPCRPVTAERKRPTFDQARDRAREEVRRRSKQRAESEANRDEP